MTIEEAQARILELETENERLETENRTLSQDNTDLKNTLEKARDLNQKLLERVTAETKTEDEDEEEEETIPSCEDFAKSIINLF